MIQNSTRRHVLTAFIVACALALMTGSAMADAAALSAAPWWAWPLALFVVCFFLGVVAVPAGVGGGVLFVPIVGGFFPFHLDYVRGAGLLVALVSALAAAPDLLRRGLADLRLALPMGVLAAASSIGGAMVGLVLPGDVVQIALGATILAIAALMLLARNTEFPSVPHPDRLGVALGLHGVFDDAANERQVPWQVRRTPLALLLFLVIGFLGGMFGVGAGWANVPTLNLLMGVPIKVAAGTSGLILSVASSSATWYYLNEGAIVPLIAAPAIAGMMLGARVGARLLYVLRASVIRKMVIGLLLFAGLRALLKGLGVWP